LHFSPFLLYFFIRPASINFALEVAETL